MLRNPAISSSNYQNSLSLLLVILISLFGFQNESLAQIKQDTVQRAGVDYSLKPPSPGSDTHLDEDNVFIIAEVMPRFPGCEEQNLKDYALTSCANEKMYAFIAQHLVYPQEAKDNGIQGQVVARFVIGKDGSISDIKIIRSIGHGTEEAVIKVLEAMPKWMPAYHNGQPVAIAFTMPFKFSIENSSKKE